MFTDDPIETGIVEAFERLDVVQPSDTPAPLPTFPIIAVDGDLITPSVLGLLAREIAWGINEIETICTTFKLSDAQFKRIAANDAFKQMVEAETIVWRAATNTEKRLKLEAAAALEGALPTIYGRMKNQFEDLNHVVAAGKLLREIAGIGGTEGQNSGEKFSITIDLGGDAKLEVQKTIKPAPPLIDHEQ